jgi:hypothetical protein
VVHLQESGFEVDTKDVPNFEVLAEIRTSHGVPADFAGCHTAVVDGYVIEGHVPADLIDKMLEERPAIAGLAVPGMPAGSPGMESPNPEPYDVMTFDRDGNTSVYARR